jgi:hypothetical protein
MNTWSSRASDAAADDAQEICVTVEKNLRFLRERRGRTQFYLNSVCFQPFQQGRNAVYRVSRHRRWFLKIPANPHAGALGREATGFAVVNEALASHPGYQHGHFRVSVDKGYLLSSEFTGRQLNVALYRSCFLPLPGAMSTVASCSYTMGGALARLHAVRAHGVAAAHSGGRFFLLQQARALSGDPRPCPRLIGEWARAHAPTDLAPPSFIYGNFSVRNVLVDGGRFCFIDFENCGAGNSYEDVATMCSELILMRAVAIVPWARVLAVLASFLNGYAAVRRYDPAILNQHIAVQLCQYYMSAFLGLARHRSTRIAGLPVIRERVERLITAFIRDDGGGVLPPLADASPLRAGA